MTSSYPNPTVGVVLVSKDDRVLAKARSDYQTDAIVETFRRAGLDIDPLSEWSIGWPKSKKLRDDLESATLYVTLEPTTERRGSAQPPITQLVKLSGVKRVVIGRPNPNITGSESKGSAALHSSGIEVHMGVLEEKCSELISDYMDLASSKLRTMAGKHFEMFGRPLGFLHCSVVDSNDIEAFARQGNAFGKAFGGQNLGQRYFGAYEIAPPPEVIWADNEDDEDFDLLEVDFEDEDFQGDVESTPIMPWYEQADAVVATFPRLQNRIDNEDSRLNGLKWLATHGRDLPAGVERVLVVDATDLKEIPFKNGDKGLPNFVDIEAFWKGDNRKPTRVLLRRGNDAQARAAAELAASEAKAAAEAAAAAVEAIETGDASKYAERTLEHQKKADEAASEVQRQLLEAQTLVSSMESMGVVVETIQGCDPIDVMKYLGERNGLRTVVWRAGCWGQTGVKAILDGAFQWVSAHLAVDAIGGRFWQLMLAENAVQAACGPERKVKIFSDQDDLSLEYCDEPDADSECSVTVKGRPVRHIRLDSRIALVDESRPREFRPFQTEQINKRFIEEQAPWFL